MAKKSKLIKQPIIAKVQLHKQDTGSNSVQIAILTARIEQISQHLKFHRKDVASRRSLLKKVAYRRKLQNQLSNSNS